MTSADHSDATASGPLDFLKEWATKNPQPAALLFGGIACFAAVAVVLGFGIRFEAAIAPIFYVLGVGIALAVATRIVNNALMMNGLSWFVLGLGILWVVTFLAYRVVPLSSTHSQQLSCVVWFWIDCRTIVDDDTHTNALPVPPSPPPPPPPVVVPPPTATGIQPAKYQVLVQFAGVLTRDSVRGMMQRLKEQGWNVQGIAGGGQRTSTAAGTAEVRARESDRAAAQALATAVQASGLTAKPVEVKPNNSVESGTLEVWISR